MAPTLDKNARTPFWATERRLARQIRRALLIAGRPLSTSELRAYCYRQRAGEWQAGNIRRSMVRFGGVRVGRANGIGRPILWVLGGKSGGN
jgi:hypothetical protein